MTDNSAETAPLLNQYKLEYFLKRLPQTFSGGLKLKTGIDAPCYVHFIQFWTFFMPMIIASLFTIAAELNPDSRFVISYVFGGLMFILFLSIHLILVITELKSKSKAVSNFYSFDDSASIEFQSCASLWTFRYIIHKKRYFINIFVHGLFSGSVNGVAFLYLLPSQILLVFPSQAGYIVYYLFGWITVCVAHYGLLAQTPPEPAQLRTTDQFELAPIMRPFYVACFAIIGVIARSVPSIASADYILRIIFPLLPLLWTLGILPPLDSLFAWLGDQTLVYLFGGSSMANYSRLFLMMVISISEVAIIFAIPDTTAAITAASCTGLLLSLDICSVLERFFKRLQTKVVIKTSEVKPPHYFSLFKWLHFLLMMLSTGVIAAFIEASILENKKSELRDAFGYVLIGIFVVLLLLGKIQSIYLLFGLVRNPLFVSFKKSKVRRFLGLSRKLLLNSVTPLLLVSFLALCPSNTKTGSAKFLFTLSSCRVFRWAWQETPKCLFDTVILMLTKYSQADTNGWWSGLDIYLQLLLINILRSRIQYLCNGLSFCLRYMTKFYFSKKVRHESHKSVGLITVMLSPIWICFFATSILLHAPLLPLFTLPLFFIGFPRPQRFWPNADSAITTSSPDSVYYIQLTQPIVDELKDILTTGSLGDISAGDFFLARFQDRLIWISVLEKGNMHTNVVIKGLELAETSCHTAEAARIDDIFEVISNDTPSPCFNPYPTHVLTPCDVLELKTYSDAKNVLTGIIDRPENLKSLTKHFMNALVWVLLRYCKQRRDKGLGDGPTMDEVKNAYEEKQVLRRPLLTNETRETILCNPPDNANNSLSLNSNSRSSVSDNSMTALWNARNANVIEPMKMVPLKGLSDGKTTEVNNFGFPAFSLPGSRGNSRGNSRENPKKENFNFTGPNIVMDDDFDEFGFDDHDNSLPCTSSWASLDIDDNNDQPPVRSEPPVRTAKTPNQAENIVKSHPSEPIRLTRPKRLPSLSADVTSPHSTHIEPPSRWKTSVPVETSDIASIETLFCEDWFKHVITLMDFTGKGERVVECIAADRGLLFIFRKLVLSCYFVLHEQQQYGALDVFRIFNGELPWSRYSQWLEQDFELKEKVLLAYRYAFKLMYDEAVLGSIDDFEELAETLLDHEENWHMGSDKDEAWKKAVLANIPNLLSVGHDVDNGTFTSRVLTKQKISVPVGRLDSENVRAIWSSLSLELYYFTNDDEERYSIQAHPPHLKNITIQAADPPLGYPVYSSGLLNVVAW